MAFPVNDGTRVRRGRYWTLFFVNMVAIIVLIGISLGAVANEAWALAIIAFLLIVPVGLYFRVVMMRRCRDIGWPPALPWITFGLGIFASFINFGSVASMDPSVLMGSMGLSSLVSLADFGLMIALGAVKGRSDMDYHEVFGDGPVQQARTAPRTDTDFAAPRPGLATGDSDAMDDAIARALDNYRRTGSAVPNEAPVEARPRRTAPAVPPTTRATGFGRKMI